MDAHACSGLGFLSYLVHQVTHYLALQKAVAPWYLKGLCPKASETQLHPKIFVSSVEHLCGTEPRRTATQIREVPVGWLPECECVSTATALLRQYRRGVFPDVLDLTLEPLFIDHGYGRQTVLA